MTKNTNKTMFDEALAVGNARVSKLGPVNPATLRVIFNRPCLVCLRGFEVGQAAAVVLTRSEFDAAPKVVCENPEHRHDDFQVVVHESVPRPVHAGCSWVFRAPMGRAS